MTTRKHNEILKTMCADVGSEDGVDPRDFHKSFHPSSVDRKARQLCRQAERALGFALSSASDDVLRDLFVERVEPAPNSSHLMVFVSGTSPEVHDAEILEHLGNAVGYLRTELAASIHRRKTPQLSFRHVVANG